MVIFLKILLSNQYAEYINKHLGHKSTVKLEWVGEVNLCGY